MLQRSVMLMSGFERVNSIVATAVREVLKICDGEKCLTKQSSRLCKML